VKAFRFFVRALTSMCLVLAAAVFIFQTHSTEVARAMPGAYKASPPRYQVQQPALRVPAGQQLSDAAVAGRFIGHANPAMRLSVALLLKGRHLDQIPALQMAQADPRSPMFRHWLTPQQYGDYFGAPQEQVQQTIAYLRSHGFVIDTAAANHRYILAKAQVGVVEAAFGTSIDMWRSPKGLYYANRYTPAIPRGLPWIQGIIGLDSYHLVHSHMVSTGTAIPPNPQATVQPGQFGFGPQDLYKAYDFNPSYTGTGQTIAIPVVRNLLLSDMFSYDSQFGISNATFTKVFLDGTCAAPCPVATTAGDAGETALDTEISHAAAPAAAITVVSQSDLLLSSMVLNFQYIANVLGSKVQAVTSSYGICESFADPAARDGVAAAIDQGVLEGQVWLVASGDDGSDACKTGLQDVDFPSSVPSIVGVGGTTLNTVNLHGNVVSYSSEYVWNNSGCPNPPLGATGGGVSRFYAKPTWQSGNTPNDKARDVPDIAAEADPWQETRFPADCPVFGGYWVIEAGNWSRVGGTSGAAPFWAGVMADLAQEQHGNLGLVLPELYKLKGTTSYHSITTGNNAFGGVPGYSAGAGYNLATGLGSPDEMKFLAQFAQARPPTPQPTSFAPLVVHPTSTPVARPTARAFIPIRLDAAKKSDVAIFDATVGINQGKQVQIFQRVGIPVDVALAASGNAVYVLLFGGIVDKITTNVTPYTYLQKVFTVPAPVRANGIAVKGTYAYITDGFNNHVIKLNTTTGASTNINVGHGPTSIVANPTAAALYFTNEGDGTVGVINSTTNTLVQTFKVGANPIRIGINHAGTMAYVANSGDGTITPVTLGTPAVPGTPVFVGGEPTSIAVNANDSLGFVTNLFCPEAPSKCSPTGNNALGVVEVLTLKTHPIGVECCIIVGQDPIAASFEPTGHYLWVINEGSNSVSVIDTITNVVVGTFSTTPATYSNWEASSSFVQLTPK
jgi:YVTN family beta-propeller protein